MVLRKSDYSLPKPGQQWDPTRPKSFLMKLAGSAFALTVVAWLVKVALNAGVPLMDQITGRIGVTSEGTTDTEVF